MADSDVIGGIENLTDAVSGETPSYEYKNPNTDMMKAISKCIDAATGETGTEYEYDNPNTDVIQKMEELAEAIASSGGGGVVEHVDLTSFAHYFARNTRTPTITQVSTTEVALTYQDQNATGYELSSYSFSLRKGIYIAEIYATTSAVGSQRNYYTWGIYSTESSFWAQAIDNTPMDNQPVNTYVPFVADTNEHFYEVPLKLLADGTGYICFATAGDGGVNATITVRSLKIRKVSIDGQ